MVSPTGSSPPPASGDPGEVPPGTLIGERYRIDRALGHGAMGKVYAAEHVLLRKRVAIKILRGDRVQVPEVVARFQREAVAAANIEHPNIAGASDFGRLPDGSVYLVLEYVEGTNLRDEIRRGPLPLPRSLHIARQIASALRAAGELQIVHRDLKPENIMLVERRGEADFVKVLDFGIARVPMAESAKQPLTKVGVVFGTPEYMSPEQALGLRVDGRADLYALGVILFEMIAGVRPFPNAARNIGQKVAASPPAFVARNASVAVPPEVEAFVHELLAPKLADRIASAADALAALESLSARFGPGATALLGVQPPPAPPRPASRPAPAADAQGPRLETFLPGDPLPAFDLPLETRDPAAAQTPAVDPPTLLRLPKVESSIPPQGPAVIEPDRAPVPRRSAPGWVTRLGEATLSLHARACAFVDSHRERLPSFVRRRVKRLRANQILLVAAALTLAVLVLFGVVVSGLRPDDAVTAERGSAGEAAPPSPTLDNGAVAAASDAEKLEALRRAASASPKDPGAELELARAEADSDNDVRALKAIERAIAGDPKLSDDPRVAGVLSDVLRSEAAQGDEEAFALLQGPLGQRGAELVYQAWLEPKNPERVRVRAKTWLDTKDFDRASSPAVYAAFKLRAAQTCEQKSHLLKLAGNVGGEHALAYLRELQKQTRCEPKQEGCYACLAEDGRLDDTIARIEQRLTP